MREHLRALIGPLTVRQLGAVLGVGPMLALAGCAPDEAVSGASDSPMPTTSAVTSTPQSTETASPTVTAPSETPSSTVTSTGSARKEVGVVVTYAQFNSAALQGEVAAFAQSFEPSGAVCRLELTNGDLTRVVERVATAGASTTDCGLLTIPAAELPAGAWTGVIRFEAPTSRGQSTPFPIQVAQ
jgi:hypothetical protein